MSVKSIVSDVERGSCCNLQGTKKRTMFLKEHTNHYKGPQKSTPAHQRGVGRELRHWDSSTKGTESKDKTMIDDKTKSILLFCFLVWEGVV